MWPNRQDDHLPSPTAIAEHPLSWKQSLDSEWDENAVCRAALAVLLARYENLQDVRFGAVEQTKDGDKDLLPIHAPVTPTQEFAELYRSLMPPGSSENKIPSNADFLSDLGVILAVTKPGSADCSRGTKPNRSVFGSHIAHALLLECRLSASDQTEDLVAWYDPGLLDERQVQWFLVQLANLITTIRTPLEGLVVQDLCVVSEEERREILRWNARNLTPRRVNIHSLISERAVAKPKTIALSTWEGDVTFSDLDNISSQLAAHLLNTLHIKREQPVLICFEKSKWIVLCMLAVLKAGGAIVLIDQSLPPARVSQIWQQTSAQFALTSKAQRDFIRDACDVQRVVVDESFLRSLDQLSTPFQSPAQPHNLAYILFTSGSTGEPKGTLIEHQAFASCCLQFGPAFGIDENTRALQFCSYAFGACLVEILTTLMLGGCVCIPSDHDRNNDIEDFVDRFQVNWAVFTPSFVRVLRPERVPSLRTLNLGGEPITSDVRDLWAPHVRIVYVYGQSESSTCCVSVDITPDTLNFHNIGRAVGSRCWITDIDDVTKLTPIGCVGELVIESPGIARGYLKATAEQSKAFLDHIPPWYGEDPPPKGVRFYKTGDMVRYGPDGSIIHLGRKDAQIKIRGQRVELGDVESHFRRQVSEYKAMVVDAIPHPSDPSSKLLIGFLADEGLKTDQKLRATVEDEATMLETSAAERIYKKLGSRLPQYAIPSYYVRIEQLPTTATGKIDRMQLRETASQLLARARTSDSNLSHDIPLSSETSLLQQIWSQAIKIDASSIRTSDNFFQLGGDSITAMKVCNVARSFGISIQIKDIYETPTLADLAAKIHPERRDSGHELIPHHECNASVVDLSFAQCRIWFLYQLSPDSCAYLIPLAARLHGPLDVKSFHRALQSMTERHDMLRTTFEQRGGIGVQVIHPNMSVDLPVVKAASLEDAMSSLRREQTTPFNLAEKSWRASLFRIGPEDHVLSIVMHHIITDGWSVDVFCRELGILYCNISGKEHSANIDPITVQYHDYTLWQKTWSESAECQKQLDYWARQLEDARPAELLCDRQRPQTLSETAGLVNFVIDGDLYRRSHDFAKSHSRNVTPFVVLLSAFRAAHFRLASTGAEDATIGTPVANRNRKELANLIGFFVNTLCIRTFLLGEETFDELVQQVRRTYIDAIANQDAPFEQVVSRVLGGKRDLSSSRAPLAQLIFALHPQANLCEFELEGIVCESLPMAFYSRSELEVHLFQGTNSWQGRVHYAKELFDHESMETLVSVFLQTLREGISHPEVRILDLPLPVDAGQEQSLAIERTLYPRESSIVEVFQEQVKLSPAALAVKDSSHTQMTYSQLDEHSTRLAAWLRQRASEVPIETMVAVLAPRSCLTIAAFLGIMKAGFAYLPLDVKAPTARLAIILSSVSGHRLVLLGTDVSAPDMYVDAEYVSILDALDQMGGATIGVPSPWPTPSANSLAYVMFTSGSTGKPKGVMIEHRGVLRLVRQNEAWNEVPPRGIIAHMSNITFDISTWEIYTAILNGGTAICLDEATVLDPEALGDAFRREGVQAAKITPVLLKHCLATSPQCLTDLDVLYVAGDRLEISTCIEARSVLAGGFGNAYGPTENTGASTAFRIDPHDDMSTRCRAPIGRPISNSGAFIMDQRQRLVRDGVIGELILTGDGLARGYYDNPAENQERFISIDLNGERVRAYRTGDYARRRPQDGQIEFFGRMDHQVKIRGHRVELGEVEQAMLSHNGVEIAVAVTRQVDGIEADIVGFVTLCNTDNTELEDDSQQVKDWTTHFDGTSFAALDEINDSRPGRDFVGWTSMYDGTIIDKSQMEEWLDDTIATILDGRPAGRVLEIGTGTGMILFNLREGLQRYVGLEPSTKAAKFVLNRARSIPSLADKVDIHNATALDVIHIDFSPETVVLNSVVQYFPSREYLQSVLDQLLQLSGVKRIVFSDLRAHSLRPRFLFAKALHNLGTNASRQQLFDFVKNEDANEEELFVDPAFFTRLIQRSPGLVEHVEILPKRMRAVNELSAFRYAVIIHLRSGRERRAIEQDAWVNFHDRLQSRRGLRSLLESSGSAREVCVRNIPDSRSFIEKAMLAALQGGNAGTDGEDWLSQTCQGLSNDAALSPMDLHDVARELGFQVEISWARLSSQDGAFDAIFHRHAPDREGSRTWFQFPIEEPTSVLTNQPTQRDRNQRFESSLLKDLREQLPSYMLPSRILVLDRMPVNASGKVDRRALADIAVESPKKSVVSKSVPPRNDLEAMLCEDFGKVLGIDVSIFDNFFEVGGHSLMATRLAARLSQRLDTKVQIADIFRYPVIADLAGNITSSNLEIEAPIVPCSKVGPARLSFAQDRLWFLDQLQHSHSQTSSYLIPMAARIRGALDLNALQIALSAIMERHELLRTTFEMQDGVGVQLLHDQLPLPFASKDLSPDEVEDALRKEQMVPFDLTTKPGWRVTVYRVSASETEGNQECVLSLMMHHIISDAWSIDILCRELATLYAAAIKGHQLFEHTPRAIQYRDFSAWQKDTQSTKHERQLEYWTQCLADSYPAEIQTDYQRPAVLPSGKDGDGLGTAGIVEFAIEGELYGSVAGAAKKGGIALFTVLLAAFRATHYRLTTVEDAVVGVPVAASREQAELADMIGLFVNTLCIRIRIDDDTSFDKLIQQVHEQHLAAVANQDVPFERVVAKLLPGARDTSRNPIVQMLFQLHSLQHLGFQLEGVQCEELPVVVSTKMDVEFHLMQGVDRLDGHIIFAKELFRRETLECFAATYKEVLRRGAADIAVSISDIALTDGLPSLRTQGLLASVRTEPYSRHSSVMDVFREQVELHANTIAVHDPATQTQMTYSELDETSERLATWLRHFALPLETLVAVLAARSCYSIVAYLALLKANLAYLPLDPNAPVGRLETILGSVPGDKLVLLGPDLPPPSTGLSDVEYVSIPDALQQAAALEIPDQTAQQDERPVPCSSPTATSLAYVMFTSGSTGKPKGVMIEHRGILRLVQRNRVAMTGIVPPAPRIAHLSNPSFDHSTFEIFTALLNGGTVVCVDHNSVLDPIAMGRLFEDNAVQVALLTPALLKLVLAENPLALRGLLTLYLAGDRFDPRDCRIVRSLFDGVLCNAYGPTENTVWSTVYQVTSMEGIADTVPIGRTIDNSGAIIVDRKLCPVSTGVVGELIVTGDGLARGYTDPTLDQDRFVNILLGGQSVRAYRTGDLARFRSDGEIDFLGRRDRQVKIRGHRIDVAEVEQTILRDDDVLDVAVVVRAGKGKEPEMIAFITAQKLNDESSREGRDGTRIEAQVRKKLRAYLPSYMIPSRFMMLARLPTNASGKVDKQELKKRAMTLLEEAASELPTAVAPRNATEAAICETFSETLGVPVGPTEDFFEAGGHSLLAMKVAARLSRQLNATVHLRDIFDFPLVADLARKINPGVSGYTPISRRTQSSPAELSFAQSRLWFLHRLDLGRSSYHIPVATRIRGNLDEEALETAISSLVERHEILRTTIEQQEDSGNGVQIAHSPGLPPLEVVEVAPGDAATALHQHQTAPFDLTTQVWRAAVFRQGPEEHILSIVIHHIAADGWSIDILCRELAALYNSAVHGQCSQLQTLPIHYSDFAVWQRQESQAECQYQLDYWAAKLENSQPAELICDYPRPHTLSGAAKSAHFEIDDDLFHGVRDFSQRTHVTPFIILLAAFRATLFRMTAVEDATFGTFSAGRDREEIMSLIGFFAKTHCLRIRVEDQSFETLVREVERTHLDALANADVPFEQIVSKLLPGARDVSRSPLAQVVFSFHSQNLLESPLFDGLDCEAVPPAVPTTRFDVEMHLYQHEASLTGVILYSSDLFHPKSMDALASVFQSLLRSAVLHPEVPVRDLPLVDDLSKSRHHGLIQKYDPSCTPKMSVVDVFLDQVAANPHKEAVKDARTQLSYEQLDQQSTQLAAWFQGHHLQSETVIGVLAPRSCEAIVAILGILKAGLAYLPLDVKHPSARLATILSSIQGQKLVLCGPGVEPPSDILDVQFVPLHEAMSQQVQDSDAMTNTRPTASSLAYVMFTSGSTGKPKGVMIEHRGIVRLVKNNTALGQLSSEMRIANLANLAFDASTWEIYSALLNGATLVCIDHETVLDSRALSDVFVREAISAALLTTALFRYCLELEPEMISRLSLLHVGGERLPARDAGQLWEKLPHGAYNACGFTEATCTSTVHAISQSSYPSHGPPIGRPIEGSIAYVMDSQQQLCPLGVMGELVVAGDGLARGYLDPSLNQDRFVKINVDYEPIRAYRTGDRVRWRPCDGELEHFGRVSTQQVKIRGHRVELEEVEAAVRACALVRDAAVVLGQDNEDLVAHIVAGPDNESEPVSSTTWNLTARIRQELQTQLTSFMLPSTFIFTDKLPVNSNGKIDRQELVRRSVRYAKESQSTSTCVAPRNELERALCEEFAALLGLTQCGVNDSFFDLGGHSLLAMKLAARLSRRFNTNISVADIFAEPVIHQLASKVLQGSALFSPIPRNECDGPVELSFAQGRLWFMERMRSESSPGRSNIPLAIRLKGRLDLPALAAALQGIEQRHEILRTTFEEREGIAVQVVHSETCRDLRVIDVSSQDALPALFAQEQTKAFDLEREAGWKALLIRIGKDHHVLSIVMHHIISDAWSVDVLRSELAKIYSAALHNHQIDDELPPLPVQFQDFAAWQRRAEHVSQQQDQLQYWKQQLADCTAAEFFCDYPRPTEASSGKAGQLPFCIEGAVYESLHAFCRKFEVTPFMILLAALRAAHFRLTGVNDAVLGTPVANRNRVELESLIGFFVNVQCMRLVVKEDDTFSDLAKHARSVVTAALANQDTPFERIVSELLPGSRDASRHPLVQVILSVNSQLNLNKWDLEGLSADLIVPEPTTRYDAEFHLFQADGHLKGAITYDAGFFDPETIENILSVFCEVLRRGLETPDMAVADLPLTDQVSILRSQGQLQVQRTLYPRDASIVDLFKEQVSSCPHAVAVHDQAMQFTYTELDSASDRIATWLHSQRVLAAESIVAVLAPRSSYTIAAFLGVLKGNCAYLPLDISAPADRLADILISVTGRLCHILLGSNVPVPSIQRLGHIPCTSIADVLDQMPQPTDTMCWQPPGPTSLAYMIFTSGSTGKPKGVMIEHRSIVRLARNNEATDAIPCAANVAHLATIAFDASAWEIYLALLKGGTVFCVNYETIIDPDRLGQHFEENKIQVATLTPALLKQCLVRRASILPQLDVLYVAGDRLQPLDCVKARQLVRGQMYNAYGPTENGICSTVYRIPRELAPIPRLPIGKAISNSGAHVIDRSRRLVSPGVVGELIVTGDGLARGYTDLQLKRCSFTDVTIEGQVCKAYCTGDLARYRPKDGQIEFLGRLDGQLKIRGGHRVEVAEIEHAILGQEGVVDAAVVVREQDHDNAELIGFVTLEAGLEQANENENLGCRFEDQLLRRLQTRLPPYMIPTRVVVLDRMPLNTSGKVDRASLTRQAQTVSKRRRTATRVPPRDSMEASVCDAFTDVLRAEIGVLDNFFEVGGHSLTATPLAARISKRLGVPTSVRDIFEHPRPADLAAKLRPKEKRNTDEIWNEQALAATYRPFRLLPGQWSEIEQECHEHLAQHQGKIIDAYPATHLQKTFVEDSTTRSVRAPATFYIDWPPQTDTDRLKWSCLELVRHFDIFRTVFAFVHGSLYQLVLDDLVLHVGTQEVTNLDTAMASMQTEFRGEFALGRPLIHFFILKGHSSVRLVISMSHALYDGLSLQQVVETLYALYSGQLQNPALKFAWYMQHVANSRMLGFEYWQSLVSQSTMTVLSAAGSSDDAAVACKAEKTIPMPSKFILEGVTPATVFTAACALMLAKESMRNDVVFGRVVSGRQSLPEEYRNVVGPCTNAVPVRVRLDSDLRKLLRVIQGQYLDGIPFETLDFDEIRENCTEWSASLQDYWCLTEFMSFPQSPASEIDGRLLRLEHKDPGNSPINDAIVTGTVDEDQDQLRLSVVAKSCHGQELVQRMLDVLCDEFARLALVQAGVGDS